MQAVNKRPRRAGTQQFRRDLAQAAEVGSSLHTFTKVAPAAVYLLVACAQGRLQVVIASQNIALSGVCIR